MKFKLFASSVCLAAFLLVPVPGLHAQANDALLQSHAKRVLRGGRFKNIHVSVQNGTVMLNGTVKYFSDKVDAQKKVKKVDPKAAIENNVQVNGRNVPDDVLEQKLTRAINYSRVGYGTTAFDAIAVQVVGNGVVRLGGYAYWPIDANTAFDIAASTPGVKDVINQIHIDPPSPLDDRIRRMEYRAIYGYPQLNQYALNPVKPIRIQVDNGHVTLYGAVDSQSDKEVAGLQAKGVPGVFSVTNDLQVAGQEH
jgi:osmotically-inducible protein OsmY